MTAGVTHWALFLAHVGALQRPRTAGPGTLARLPGVGDTGEDMQPLREEEIGLLGLLPADAGSASDQTGPGKGKRRLRGSSHPLPNRWRLTSAQRVLFKPLTVEFGTLGPKSQFPHKVSIKTSPGSLRVRSR